MIAHSSSAIRRLVSFLREDLGQQGRIPLHAPTFGGREKDYVADCIDSTYVSSVGDYVVKFENEVARRSGCAFGVATMNGTAAIHALLHTLGVGRGDLVICPALTFVATVNAVLYTGAQPVFLDSDPDTLGLSLSEVERFLQTCERRTDGVWFEGQRVRAALPVHIFGHVIDVVRLSEICAAYGVIVVEDAAESLGASRGGRQAGSLSVAAALSFNGNKVVTTGGGGAIVTNDEALAIRLKHLTTTARAKQGWTFFHDEMGFNYRMPNLNAALGLAQMEQLDGFIRAKRELADRYEALFQGCAEAQFVKEAAGVRSNYWLQAIMLPDLTARNEALEVLQAEGIEARPCWTLMIDLPYLKEALRFGDLAVARDIESRLVNIPSSPSLMTSAVEA